jgi:hypothetical protein
MDATVIDPKVAEIIIEEVGSMIDLVFTVSTAVCGGLIAITIQILLNNSDPSTKALRLKCPWLLFCSIACEGFAASASYFARSCLTAVTPNIFTAEIEPLESWALVGYPGSEILRWTMYFQFAFFAVGLLAIFIFLVANKSLLTILKHETK